MDQERSWGQVSNFVCRSHRTLLTLYSSGSLIGPGLLTTEGEQHRKQRKMLTPVFSVAYLRNVTTLFYETSSKVSSPAWRQSSH